MGTKNFCNENIIFDIEDIEGYPDILSIYEEARERIKGINPYSELRSFPRIVLKEYGGIFQLVLTSAYYEGYSLDFIVNDEFFSRCGDYFYTDLNSELDLLDEQFNFLLDDIKALTNGEYSTTKDYKLLMKTIEEFRAQRVITHDDMLPKQFDEFFMPERYYDDSEEGQSFDDFQNLGIHATNILFDIVTNVLNLKSVEGIKCTDVNDCNYQPYVEAEYTIKPVLFYNEVAYIIRSKNLMVEFCEFIKETNSSYDGFWSHTCNNGEDFLALIRDNKLDNDRFNKANIHQVLEFLIDHLVDKEELILNAMESYLC